MKYIEKKKEPKSLHEYRETPGASYHGPKQDWQEQLLKEQGHLCAYCMARISLKRRENGQPRMGIEHLESRELFPEKQLLWSNMVAVCNGDHGSKPHCDKTAAPEGKINGQVVLKKLNPTAKSTSENCITYTSGGKVVAIADNPDVQEDLDIRLNLNDPLLISTRKAVLEVVLKKLRQAKPDGAWNQQLFDNAIKGWTAPHENQYQPYCQVAIWYLNWLKARPRYQ